MVGLGLRGWFQVVPSIHCSRPGHLRCPLPLPHCLSLSAFVSASLLATVSRLNLPSRLPPSASAYPLPLHTFKFLVLYPLPRLPRSSLRSKLPHTLPAARCTPHTSYLISQSHTTSYQTSSPSLRLRTSYLINRRPALFPLSILNVFLCCLRPPRISGLACLYPYFTLDHCDGQP